MDTPPRNRELEGLVLDALSGPSAAGVASWQVYADWLLDQGEPIGEWLAAQLRAAEDDRAAERVRDQLAEIERACSFRLIDLELADLLGVPSLTRILELEWAYGFIVQAQLRLARFEPWDVEMLGHTPDRLLEAILRSPAARLLWWLILDGVDFRLREARHRDLGSLLAAMPEPPPLRVLELHQRAEYGALRVSGAILDRLPGLGVLSVSSSGLELTGEITHHGLRRLSLIGGKSTGERQLLASLSAWCLPGLEELILMGQVEGQREPAAQAELCRVIEGLPRLRTLQLELGDAALAELARSPALERLESLGIGGLGDAGAATMLAEPRFASLGRISIWDPRLSPSYEARLRDMGCQFPFG